MKWLREKIRSAWARFRSWIVGILIALGLITGAVQGATVTFTYTPATEYVDGSAMPLSDIDFTRLYCNGAMVDEEPGADGEFSVLLGFGSYDCYATHVVNIATTPESDPSNTVTKVVNPAQPNPPVLN
jgi:hypothetical protein